MFVNPIRIWEKGEWNSGVHSESTCRRSGSGSWGRIVLMLNISGWRKCWRLAGETPLPTRTCCVSVSLAQVSVSLGFCVCTLCLGPPNWKHFVLFVISLLLCETNLFGVMLGHGVGHRVMSLRGPNRALISSWDCGKINILDR